MNPRFDNKNIEVESQGTSKYAHLCYIVRRDVDFAKDQIIEAFVVFLYSHAIEFRYELEGYLSLYPTPTCREALMSSVDREDASSMVTAGATANTTEGNSRASRESGLLCSHVQGNISVCAPLLRRLVRR